MTLDGRRGVDCSVMGKGGVDCFWDTSVGEMGVLILGDGGYYRVMI